MRSAILLASVLLTLCGCSTPQERAQKQQAEMDQMIVEFGPACEKLGYAVRSDPWRNCVVQLAAKNAVGRGGVSTSIFGSWGNWGRWGRGSGVGAGVTMGR
ncbi:MAG: hypothetical protein JWP59_508 [Massilia sp.]|nr:hypothetical protein [Massilia sp.]